MTMMADEALVPSLATDADEFAPMLALAILRRRRRQQGTDPDAARELEYWRERASSAFPADDGARLQTHPVANEIHKWRKLDGVDQPATIVSTGVKLLDSLCLNSHFRGQLSADGGHALVSVLTRVLAMERHLPPSSGTAESVAFAERLCDATLAQPGLIAVPWLAVLRRLLLAIALARGSPALTVLARAIVNLVRAEPQEQDRMVLAARPILSALQDALQAETPSASIAKDASDAQNEEWCVLLSQAMDECMTLKGSSYSVSDRQPMLASNVWLLVTLAHVRIDGHLNVSRLIPRS